MPRKEDASDCRAGTYDLLRKNCNSFRWCDCSFSALSCNRCGLRPRRCLSACSDCALYFLLGKRIDAKYRSLEQVRTRLTVPISCTCPVPSALCPQRLWLRVQLRLQLGAKYQSIVAQASGGGYQPNPKADRFDVRHVSPQKHVHVPALSNRNRRRAAPRDSAGWWT